MNRVKLLIASILILSIGIVSCKKTEKQPKLEKYKGILISVIGKVTVNGKPAKKYHIINKEDKIATAAKSSFVLKVGEKSVFKVNEKSELVFSIGPNSNNLKLNKGWMAGVSKSKFTDSGTFYVSTPSVVAGVRGTSMCLKVEDSKNTYFCVCNGSIWLKGVGSEDEDKVKAKHHTDRRFTIQDDGTVKVTKPDKMLYHTDKTIEALGKIVGVKIDWTKDH